MSKVVSFGMGYGVGITCRVLQHGREHEVCGKL